MKNIVELINTNSDWLYVKILESPFFFFDFWSLAHLWSGGVLFALFTASKLKHRWTILISFLILYEILEITIIYLALNVFRPETIKDQVTDILMGVCGGFIVNQWLKFYSSPKNSSLRWALNPYTYITLLTAVTISFLWVGFYKYEYNYSVLNSNGLNYTAMFLWTSSLFIIINIYLGFLKRTNKIYSIGLTWIVYFIGLCLFEFTCYHLLGVKESGAHGRKPLIFDIVHGTTFLHVVYLLFPFIAIGGYSVFKKLSNTALINVLEIKGRVVKKKKYEVVKMNEAL